MMMARHRVGLPFVRMQGLSGVSIFKVIWSVGAVVRASRRKRAFSRTLKPARRMVAETSSRAWPNCGLSVWRMSRLAFKSRSMAGVSGGAMMARRVRDSIQSLRVSSRHGERCVGVRVS